MTLAWKPGQSPHRVCFLVAGGRGAGLHRMCNLPPAGLRGYQEAAAAGEAWAVGVAVALMFVGRGSTARIWT
jgi:hypothetical protein